MTRHNPIQTEPASHRLLREAGPSMQDPRTAPLTRYRPASARGTATSTQRSGAARALCQELPWQAEVSRDSRLFADRPLRQAAVLVPIVLRSSPTVLLTRRADQLSSHSGQIAFPGGKVDESDADAIAASCARPRRRSDSRRAGSRCSAPLPEYLTGSAYRITPVVGLVQPAAEFRPNPHEVADLFEVPLSFLMDPAHHQRRAMDWQGQRHEWFAMPYADGGIERFIWGRRQHVAQPDSFLAPDAHVTGPGLAPVSSRHEFLRHFLRPAAEQARPLSRDNPGAPRRRPGGAGSAAASTAGRAWLAGLVRRRTGAGLAGRAGALAVLPFSDLLVFALDGGRAVPDAGIPPVQSPFHRDQAGARGG